VRRTSEQSSAIHQTIQEVKDKMTVRLIEKGMLLGLGVLTLTREKVVQAVNSLVEEGEVEAEEAPTIIDRLVSRGEEERKELRKMMREELDRRRITMSVASRKDIEALSQKIDELAARIDELTGEKTGKK
jgi:polyhydroxyalkanoate synthesis regulator phasin